MGLRQIHSLGKMAVFKICMRFARDERGATAIMFAVSLIPIMAALGAAIDGARWYNARQRTSASVDSAVLAGARALQVDPGNTAAALDTAKTLYLANAAKRGAVKSDTVQFVLTDSDSAVTVTGNAVINTTFLQVVGIKDLPLLPHGSAGAKASFRRSINQGSNIELSLVLDFTGSMCNDGTGPCTSSSKIDGLKTAAKDLVNIVVQDTQSPYTSRIALVPFSTRIRVEADSGNGSMMKKLTNLDPTWTGWYRECIAGTGDGGAEGGGNWSCQQYANQLKTNWKILPCVTDRVYGTTWSESDQMDYTDEAPGPGRWLNAHGGDRAPFFGDSSGNYPYPTGTGSSSSQPADHWTYSESAFCGDVDNNNIVTPLSANKTLLKSQIDGYSAGGATAGALATAWSWYTLSPKWSTIWNSASLPGTYSDLTNLQSSGAPKLRKVVVLMTDGVFNSFRGGKDFSQTMVSNHAKNLCAAMKAQDIEIYTVGFALDELTSSKRTIAEDVLKSCGTDLAHFYATLTIPELQAAFRDIAVKVTPIRLTQ
jgi:Flp pilus assembly protein TadG